MSTAAEILARVSEVYATCRSYRDIGEVTSVTITGDKPWQRSTRRRPFQTAFVRDGGFLFEFKDMGIGPDSEWPHCVVWKNSGGVHEWSTLGTHALDPHGSTPTLEDAIAWLTGISAGAAHTVPHLLGLVAGRDPLSDFASASDPGVDEVDGRPCWRLAGAHFGRAGACWFDSERGLLLRSFDRAHLTPESMRLQHEAALARPDLTDELREIWEKNPPSLDREFTIETTTFYRPEIDVEIDAKVFDVRPPA